MKSLTLVLVTGIALFGSSQASAATFTVNSTADGYDANLGDGICAAAGGACTLRAAVEQANALGGAQSVVVPSGVYALTISPYHLSVDASGAEIKVSGAGLLNTVLEGSQLGRIFWVRAGASLILESMYIKGDSLGTDGCFLNEGNLRLDRVLVMHCTNHGDGGAIRNTGALVVRKSTLQDNHSNSGFWGGAISNDSTMLLASVKLSGNTAAHGGAVYLRGGGYAELSDVHFQGNSAINGGAVIQGGAISHFDRVTLDGNASTGEGGALYLTVGSAELTNVTFSGNSASDQGGAIVVGNGATLSLRNVTITGSSDDGTAGALYWRGGAVTVSMANTLIAANGAINCNFPVTSLGHNLEDHFTCGLGAPGDLVGVTPLLGPLADNQGPTLTVALLAGSPGIDDGDDTLAASSDQRGVSRPQDGDENGISVSDIGAFELADLLFFSGFEEGDTSDWSRRWP